MLTSWVITLWPSQPAFSFSLSSQPFQSLPVGQFPLANNIIVSKADCHNYGLGTVDLLFKMERARS